MPIVNYVREHTRFIQYASDEHIPANERLLWYALMHIMNQRAQGNVWPDEFIRINNDLLLSYCAMRYDTMATARNGLKQRGLIDYEPGKKNVKSPAYRMVYFYPEYVSPETGNDRPYPNISDNIGGKPCYNIGGNIRGNIGGNIPNNSINYTKEYDTEMDEEDEDIKRARELVRTQWNLAFGTKPTEYAVSQIVSRGMDTCQFELPVILRAVNHAALKSHENPVGYILELFSDWSYMHIRTEDDLDEYLMLKDIVQQYKGTTMQERAGRDLVEFRLKRLKSEKRGEQQT